MITFVIAEAALETVPKELADHPSVRRSAERKGKGPEYTLLDISYHYAAMKDLKDWGRRGRPDITYLTLLNLLERPINKEGQLRVYVHTLKDYIIEIDPEISLPRNYARFIGLVEQLFELNKIPPKGKPLMVLKKGSLKDLVDNIDHTKTVFMTERGKHVSRLDYFGDLAKTENPLIIVGGFQKGEFFRHDLELADEKISIYKQPLDAWIVASIVSHEIEKALGIV